MSDITAAEEAYMRIDRYLRNNLNDIDYAEYSAALDQVSESGAIDKVNAARKEEDALHWQSRAALRLCVTVNPYGSVKNAEAARDATAIAQRAIVALDVRLMNARITPV